MKKVERLTAKEIFCSGDGGVRFVISALRMLLSLTALPQQIIEEKPELYFPRYQASSNTLFAISQVSSICLA